MQKKRQIYLPDELATERLGHALAEWMLPPSTVLFYGEIGAGKTTLIRAILQAMGVACSIKSPTFSIVETYEVCLGKKNANTGLLKVPLNSENTGGLQEKLTDYKKDHIDNVAVHHFDLYRIQDISEIHYIGFDEYFTQNAICFVEWPERVSWSGYTVDLEIHINHLSIGREIFMKTQNDRYSQFFSLIETI